MDDIWLTKPQIIGGALVLVVLMALAIMATVVVTTIYLSATTTRLEAEAEPIVISASHTRIAPIVTVASLLPAQTAPPVSASGYQLEVTESELSTPVPVASNLPTPTVVYLDAALDFTSETPLVGWPAGGQMTQGFGCTPNYTEISGPNCPDDAPWFHGGVDIGAYEGAPVRAAMAGKVVFAEADSTGPWCGEYRGYGLAVMLENGADWEALYAHLSRLEVEVGQQVGPETIIGAVGQTGCTSGPHLHFGLRYQGTLVDAGLHMPENVYE